MQTFEEMYEELIVCKKRWSYYKDPPSLCYNKLFSENESFEFIEKYFAHVGKASLFDNLSLNADSDLIKKRAPHIVSTYLLGIIIAETFGFDLSTRDDANMNLKYLWFLSCLYHDIGYIYEATPCCKYLRDIQARGMEALKEICDIEYCESGEFATYSYENIDLYLSGRAKCQNGKTGVIDHGIAGGLMLYDRLRKNYCQAWKTVPASDKEVATGSFTYNGLNFSKQHFKYYAEAADAIIAHNIWVDTLNKYLEEKGCQCQSISKIQEDHKVAFLLAVADTIEPIKRYGRYGFFALQKIKYGKTTNGFYLFMPDINNYSDTFNYLIDLSKWVDVTVEKEAENIFLIQRNGNELQTDNIDME